MADLAWVVDDDVSLWRDGCDAVSVIDTSTGEGVAYGDWYDSFPHVTVSADGLLAIAPIPGSPLDGITPQLYVLSRASRSALLWRTSRFEIQGLLNGAPAAFSPDNSALLLVHEQEVVKHSVGAIGPRTVGPRRGVFRLTGGKVAAIVFAPDSSIAYLADTEGRIHSVDVDSMEPDGAPIQYIPPQTYRNIWQERVRQTFLAISPDGRFLTVNGGLRPQLEIVDLASRTAVTVAVSGLQESHGLAYDHSEINRGLLAVHGRTSVNVYRTRGTQPPVLLSSATVPPQSLQTWKDNYLLARMASIAWTGRGDAVIASIGSKKEFRILEFDERVGRGLSLRTDFDACTAGRALGAGLDVVTLNDRLLRSTLTVTPTPSVTITPSRTDRPTTTPSSPTTATASSTTTMTPTPTASPTPTATSTPALLFLPLSLRERCDPVHERSDIALVLDTSSSMTGPKIEDARGAALAFVGLIDLAPGRSQVAVVRYDREAEVVRELTNARALIEAAIRNLQVRSGTNIDKGLRTALGELQSPRHLDRNAQVLILLTDGVQTGTPGEELRAAAEAHAAGVMVYTIGLGADVDEATLRAIAGADDRYYFAPDSGDLARIYGEIARDLMCPGVDLWAGR
ncbi:MAG: VWA domain-containing protein [Polyangiaceae bacterium]|nr:VWA domain-containing protein [Polyangiaceae bacterium]